MLISTNFAVAAIIFLNCLCYPGLRSFVNNAPQLPQSTFHFTTCCFGFCSFFLTDFYWSIWWLTPCATCVNWSERWQDLVTHENKSTSYPISMCPLQKKCFKTNVLMFSFRSIHLSHTEMMTNTQFDTISTWASAGFVCGSSRTPQLLDSLSGTFYSHR